MGTRVNFVETGGTLTLDDEIKRVQVASSAFFGVGEHRFCEVGFGEVEVMCCDYCVTSLFYEHLRDVYEHLSAQITKMLPCSKWRTRHCHKCSEPARRYSIGSMIEGKRALLSLLTLQ